MLVNSKEMLIKARRGKYAVPAFNVENMETVVAVLKGAEEENSPVILQTTPSSVKYATTKMFYAMAAEAARKSKTEVCLHLDHGESFLLCAEALIAGYTSVMIDGSKLPFDENVALTKKTVELAVAGGASVEGELGKVGGKEDELEGEADTLTGALEALEFAEKTGVDSLAVAIGTAHGVYKTAPILSKERLREIAEKVSIPLVLHGASGLLHYDIKDCVALGISKVNFATELRQAFTGGVRQSLLDAEVIDPKKYLKAGSECVTELVKSRIAILGSKNKSL